MRYEDTVRKICGDDWKTVAAQEKEGGFGVAIVTAYLRGCRPAVNDLVAHLSGKPGEVTPDDIIAPYTRLMRAGVFSKDWGARKDKALLNQTGIKEDFDRAMSHVAGIAGGFIGVAW